MTIEYIRYTVADGDRREALIEAYRIAAVALDKSPECLAYELSVCEEDASSAMLRIEWQSTEAHLQGFRKSAAFGEFYRAIGSFVSDIAEMRHYRVTDVVKR